jgi:N-acetylglucosamine kinase-like BadF-type ATPase
MSYSLGFDGGGTKTHCVVLDAAGKLIGETLGGPSNPLRCGYDAAFQSLSQAAAGALSKAGLRTTSITAVCAGLAGAGGRNVVRRMMVFLSREFPKAVVHVTTDLEIALETAVGSGPGVVLIAGTGSAAFGRNSQGETARAGGYGPWVGDEGSAFEIGRRAVGAVARARDQAGPPTLLTEMIPVALACPDWDDLMQRIMTHPDDVFPKLFPVVAEAADVDDSAAKEILFTAAIGLASLAMIVVRRLGMKEITFPLYKYGGVFGCSKMLDTLLDSVLTSGALRVKLSHLENSPAVGAARIGARLIEPSPRASSHGA